MKLPADIERLILPPAPVGKFVPDEYDIEMSDLIDDWHKADHADVGIIGIPFDTGVVIRRGCRFGPDGVRTALAMSTSYEPGVDVDLVSSGIKIVDFGNVDAMFTDLKETHRRVEAVITEVYKLGVTPLILGGDHSLAYPDIKALTNVTNGNVGVIMIDGHLDLRISHHGEISSGTPFRRMLEEIPGQPVRPENFVEIGINGWHNNAFYMDYARKKGIRVISAREVHQRGIEDVVDEALTRATDGVKALFLSFDIDGLDMAAAPGTCAPNPGGLTAYQGLEAVWRICQHPLCRGIDIVEVAPPLDVLGLTSMMGAALAMHFIGARAKAKTAGGG
ncbi:MAG: agmatinase [Bacillota bacterium]|nr:MAG: agmatinase [Bacillota bacterium]